MSYRVLSLDGGGSWALIEVLALIAIYGPDTPGREVLSNFDLIAANSGGSIVLACLVENMTLRRILEFFENQQQRDSIFRPTSKPAYRVFRRTGVVPKYSASSKLAGLQRVLPKTGNECLGGITADVRSKHSGKPVHLLIVSFDYDRNRATFFRSSTVSRFAWGSGAAASVTLAEAVHASANPPVDFFDAPASFSPHSSRYWDGGIAGCNNPVLAAVAEAVGIGTPPNQILALSLGSGAVERPPRRAGHPPSPLFAQRATVSWHGDLEKLAESILDDPPDIASFLAHIMTGSGLDLTATLPNGQRIDSRIVRMNPLVSPVKRHGRWTTPAGMSLDAFEYLTKLSLDAIEAGAVEAITQYAMFWLRNEAPNQPVRLDTKTLGRELGQAWFRDALAAWLILTAL